MLAQIRSALTLLALLTLLTGLAYPAAVTAVARAAMPAQAEGSLIEHDGRVIGSRLIGQAFAAPGYLHPRPSAGGYDTEPAAASNLAPTNSTLIRTVAARVAAYRAANGVTPPIDAVTSSASGLDPDISPENAFAQAGRIAAARGVARAKVMAVLRAQMQGRWLGLFGQARVNVLAANLALDAAFARASPAAKG